MGLRPYQHDCNDRTERELEESDSTLVVMATGLGKTVTFSDLIKRRTSKRTLVIAHRQELIFQAKAKIEQYSGLRAEIEMGNLKATASHADFFKQVGAIVSSIQTLTSGGDGLGRMSKFLPDDIDTLIVDEAHHATAPSYRRTIDYFRQNPECKIIGYTATPDRCDEAALGQVFETVAFEYEMREAIHDGWLVPIVQQMVEVSSLDFSNVRTTAGDLNGADLAQIMESEKNLHNVAGPSIDLIGDRQTLVFTSSVNHARMLSEIFNRHRIGMANWVCGKTEDEDRKRINADFDAGKIQVLCNCGTHTEGYDSPNVACVVMAKPTKSRALYAQMIGRGTRPLTATTRFLGILRSNVERVHLIAGSRKPSCLAIDFVGNSGSHKLVCSADALGGKVDEEVLEKARARARSNGGQFRMDLLIEDEEQQKAEREKRRIEDEARRVRLIGKAKYSNNVVDPFDVLKLRPVVARGWEKKKTLSEKQTNMLRRNSIDPTKLEFAKAKAIIDELFRRMDKKLCSYKMAKKLREYGYNPDMTFDQARKTLDALAANGWRRPAKDPVPASEIKDPNAQEDIPEESGELAEDDNVPF